jgi:hypothetical protein
MQQQCPHRSPTSAFQRLWHIPFWLMQLGWLPRMAGHGAVFGAPLHRPGPAI